MEKKTFEISQIETVDNLNALSIALNAKEQVSHIKIDKDSITFHCLNIDALMNTIHNIDNQVVVKEIVNGHKRTYDFAKRKEIKHYYMFRNVVNQDDVNTLIENIKEDHRYKDVEYDLSNHILTLTTSYKDTLNTLRKELYKISPSIQINEYRKPIRSQDVFNQKFVKTYIKVALFVVTLALALITEKDNAPITPFLWMITVFMTGDEIISSALKQIRLKKFLHSDVVFFLAMLLGVGVGHYVEVYAAVLFYRFTAVILSKVLERSLNDIDEAVTIPEVATILKNNEESSISLYEFEKGDILVVKPQQIIPIPGHVVKGNTQLNTYPNTSTYDLLDVTLGQYVHSGDINVGEETLYIEVSKPYESSRYIELMTMASNAPIYESVIEKFVKKLSRYYTPVMVILAIITGVVLPIMDYKEYSYLMHVGAVLMFLSGSFSSEESASLGTLAAFAKAFSNGIIIESAKGLDSINVVENIVYDRYDGMDVTEEELALFKKLSRLGRKLIIFNDGPFALESDQYTIYNSIGVEEKLDIMDKLIGECVYIGDSYKDITLLQKSFVGISRGGLGNSKVVENSDIVLIDSDMNKVYETFVIARKMRTHAIINTLINLIYKTCAIIAVLSFASIPLWLAVVGDIIISALIIRNSTRILG